MIECGTFIVCANCLQKRRHHRRGLCQGCYGKKDVREQYEPRRDTVPEKEEITEPHAKARFKSAEAHMHIIKAEKITVYTQRAARNEHLFDN